MAEARGRRKRDRELSEEGTVRELSPLPWGGEAKGRGQNVPTDAEAEGVLEENSVTPMLSHGDVIFCEPLERVLFLTFFSSGRTRFRASEYPRLARGRHE